MVSFKLTKDLHINQFTEMIQNIKNEHAFIIDADFNIVVLSHPESLYKHPPSNLALRCSHAEAITIILIL